MGTGGHRYVPVKSRVQNKVGGLDLAHWLQVLALPQSIIDSSHLPVLSFVK